MLIWFILALIVFAISFVLAFRSMGDYRESSQETSAAYSLFLVGKPRAFTIELMVELYQSALAGRKILSLERLFRGSKRALVIFGPHQLLWQFREILGLVELEDYCLVDRREFSTWEMGRKNNDQKVAGVVNFTASLAEGEEFWWQLVLQPALGSDPVFKATVRAAILAADKSAAQSLQKKFTAVGSEAGLVMLPQAYSGKQLAKFYQERSLSAAPDPKGEALTLSVSEVIYLLGL